MMQIEKLVVITRQDISSGYQAVQSCHAAIQFVYDHPGRAGPWFNNSNYLVLLSVKDEEELWKLVEKADKLGLKMSLFKEPDINNQLTAICLEPSILTQKLVKNIQLALM